MSTLTNTCPACGAEESLDSLLARMVDDDGVRRLIADVLIKSLPLGALVVRYLRLFKPPKQKLRMATVEKVLAELVPDIQRAVIERKGRVWATSPDSWKAAFQAVFEANDKGNLTLPLQGNGYLYEVLLRMADKVEAAQERGAEDERRQRAGSVAAAAPVADLVASVLPPAQPRRDSPLVRQMKAEIAARRGQGDAA